MSEESYRIPGTNGSLPVMGHLTTCGKCGRKMLVELALIGTPHHIAVIVTCGECLEPSEQIRKEHPEILAQVEKWLHDSSNQNEPEGVSDGITSVADASGSVFPGSWWFLVPKRSLGTSRIDQHAAPASAT